MTVRTDIVYCRDCSRDAGERLFASAPRADVWLMLEYGGPWGAKALPESDFPDAIKVRLQAWLDATPNSKFLFIKHHDGAAPGPRLYVALTREVDPRLYAFTLADYDDLLALDLDAIARGDSAFYSALSDDSLLLVCTNGRRDIACAKYGLPVYNALVEQGGLDVWQATHMGGHRFAGVVAALPSGVCYGYLEADDAPDLLRAVHSNEILVENTRGRSCYEPPVQAADYFLRGITGVLDVACFRLRSLTPAGDDTWTVRFDVLPEARAYDVTVRRVLSDFTTYESTGDPERKHVPQFHLVSFGVAEEHPSTP
jgi:hypothetical protein